MCFSVYLASCILSLICVAVASACTSRIPASRALAAMAARVKIRWHSNQLSGEKKRRGAQTASGTRQCCRRRQFARRNCVRAAALPITNRDVLDLTDRSRESSRGSRSRIILERGRERKRESETVKEREGPLRRVSRDAYSRGVRGTSSLVHLYRLMHRGARFSVKYSDKLPTGGILKMQMCEFRICNIVNFAQSSRLTDARIIQTNTKSSIKYHNTKC